EAYAIKVEKLLSDVKEYLKSNPPRLDWEHLNIGNLGYRLVEKEEKTYLGDKVAAWDMELKPRDRHVDDRITISTPLVKPGASLLKAQMEKGNLSRIIVWVNDTVIAKKQLDGQSFYFVADAETGKAVDGAKVEFFGWRQIPLDNTGKEYRVVTDTFTEDTD